MEIAYLLGRRNNTLIHGSLPFPSLISYFYFHIETKLLDSALVRVKLRNK